MFIQEALALRRCFLYYDNRVIRKGDIMRRRSSRSGGPSLSYINRERKVSINIFYQVLQWIFLVFIAVFLGVALIFAFGIRTSVIGESMEPGLSNANMSATPRNTAMNTRNIHCST